MKKFLLIAFLFVLVAVPFGANQSMAFNTYGGPCSTAQMYNWENKGWNAMCVDFMIAMDALCASSGGDDYYCDTLQN